jgi:hypothetical protein
MLTAAVLLLLGCFFQLCMTNGIQRHAATDVKIVTAVGNQYYFQIRFI